jgi:hypothetical protein
MIAEVFEFAFQSHLSAFRGCQFGWTDAPNEGDSLCPFFGLSLFRPDEVFQGVFDQLGVAMVGEATSELVDDAGELLDLVEQQRAAIGGDVPAVEGGEDLAGSEGGEVEVDDVLFSRRGRDRGPTGGVAGPAAGGFAGGGRVTLCRHRVSFRWSRRCLPHK